MIKRILNLCIILSLLFTVCPMVKSEVNAAATKSVNILFIGNSKTYYNNMPKMLNNMLSAAGKKNVYKVLVKGSHSLNFHYNYILNNENEIKALFKNKIDYVILNEQTDVQLTDFGETYDSDQDPDPSKRYTDKRIFGNLKDDSINILNKLHDYDMITKKGEKNKNDPGTRIILNATWNIQNNYTEDEINRQLTKSNSNFKNTRKAIIKEGYSNCYIAYTGNAIKEVKKEMNKTKNRKFSKQSLFVDQKQIKHPTVVGSYIEALTLYKAMMQKNMTANYGGYITKSGMNKSRDNYVEIYDYNYLEHTYTNVSDFVKKAFNKSQIDNIKDYKKIRDFINSKITSYI